MIELLLLALLLAFVAWGATTDPSRLFSWAMYSGSAKGFLWTEVSGTPRTVSYDELGLSPESHYLPLPQLRQLITHRPPPVPLQGLLIGSAGNWLVTYHEDNPLERQEAPLPAGTELDHLTALLRRFPDR